MAGDAEWVTLYESDDVWLADRDTVPVALQDAEPVLEPLRLPVLEHDAVAVALQVRVVDRLVVPVKLGDWLAAVLDSDRVRVALPDGLDVADRDTLPLAECVRV